MLSQLLRSVKKYQSDRAYQRSLHRYEACKTPWSEGYWEYRWRETEKVLADDQLLRDVAAGRVPKGYGVGLDERIVEFPWTIGNLNGVSGKLFDGGSTLNHRPIIDKLDPTRVHVTFGNLAVEPICLFPSPVSYMMADLRNLPFRDEWFDATTCISTIEHVGMNNAIYGHSPNDVSNKTFDYLDAVDELLRVTRPGGLLLISVPIGKYENHGFFQQFDQPLLAALTERLALSTKVDTTFFRYRKEGWSCTTWDECSDAESFNPHTGAGKGDDQAAHCRAVACLRAVKNQ